MNVSGLEEVVMRSVSHAKGESILILDCPAGVSSVRLSAGMPDSVPFFFSRDFADYTALAGNIDGKNSIYGAWHTPQILHDSAIIFLPRGREALKMTLDMVRRAVKPGGTIMIAGEKRGGMGAARTLLEDACENIYFSVSARHCVVIAGKNRGPGDGPGSLDGWMTSFQVEALDKQIVVTSCPGVFSHGRLDPATAILLENLEKLEAKSALDFGCGSGIIGAAISLAWESLKMDMLDSSALAVESSKRTMESNGIKNVRIMPSDGFMEAGNEYDLIASNPPFHAGPTMEFGVIEMLWREAEERLAPGGRLVLVTSGSVPSRLTEEGGMKKVKVLKQTRNYRVTEAAK